MADDDRIEPARSRERIRGRLVIALLVVAVVAASGPLLARVGVAGGPPAPAAASELRTGAWFCPQGGGRGWRAWVVASNPGPRPVDVRVTGMGPSGSTAPVVFTLGPSRQRYVEVAARTPAAATEVEFFGGFAAAAAVVERPGGTTAAERCVAAARAPWYLPDLSTVKGNDAVLVLANPFAVPADANVTFRSERETVSPGALSPIVLPPGSVTAIPVGHYLLAGPGEQTVAAVVVAKEGRVVAGSVVATRTGFREEGGVSRPSRIWLVPAGGSGGGAGLALMNVGRAAAIVSIVIEGGRAATASGVPTRVPAGSVRTLPVVGLTDAAAVVRSTNRMPLAVSLVTVGPGGGVASLTGADHAALRWDLPPLVPPTGGAEDLVLQNHGPRDATVSFAAFGARGPVPAPSSITVPSERTVVVRLAGTLGGPFTVVATSSVPVVAGEAVVGRAGYALALGFAIPR